MSPRALRIVTGAMLLVWIASIAIAALRPGFYVRWRDPIRYEHYIVAHGANYGVPPALLAAVAKVESDFDPSARSPAGAVGLMQLTPATAEGIAKRTGGTAFERSDLLDPEISLRYGAWYLAHLHGKYARDDRGAERDDDEAWLLALAAYNAGQGNVDRWLVERADDVGRLTVERIPFGETRRYVERVRELRGDYERAWPSLHEDAS